MVLDIRATVNCSLGEVISASINDDYVQGAGLVKYSGSCEINDIITPAIGTPVTFSYTKSGVIRTIPRKLRVLSSFADPFRRTTNVELGCKLTYLSDVRAQTKWTEPSQDPRNLSFPAEAGVYKWLLPYHAQSAMDRCLSELGITASSSPLTSRLSAGEYDFSGGWVDTLSNLLVSESYFGYLDENEILQIVSLSQDGGAGPVLDSSNLIDIRSINVGQLPAEAVVVSFELTSLKRDKEEISDIPIPSESNTIDKWLENRNTESARRGLGLSHSVSSSRSVSDIGIPYEKRLPNGTTEKAVAFYTMLDTSETVLESEEGYYSSKDGGEHTLRNMLISRTVYETRSAAGVAGAYFTALLEATNGSASNYSVPSITYESIVYNEYGDEVQKRTVRTCDGLYIAGALDLPYLFTEINSDGSASYVVPAIPTRAVSANSGSSENTLTALEEVVVITERTGGSVITTTYRYGPWWETPQGQQAVSAGRDSFQSAGEVTEFLVDLINFDTLVLLNATTTVDPDQDWMTAQNNDKPSSVIGAFPPMVDAAGKPVTPSWPMRNQMPSQRSQVIDLMKGWSKQNQSFAVYAIGSASAQRQLEMTLPYPTSYSMAVNTGRILFSDLGAAAQARQFGRVQNRLLAGNRNGMNIQTAPELLPGAPFSPFVVQANGVSGLYRTNGTSWTMSPDGVIVSTDALFWGGVGGTGSFWFPVAPGITTLPATPPIVDGQMVVDRVVPIWNETVFVESTTKVGCNVQAFNYALTRSVVNIVARVRTRVVLTKVTKVAISSSGILSLAGNIPTLLSGGSARVGTKDIATFGIPPTVSGGKVVLVPVSSIAVDAIMLLSYGGPATRVWSPAAIVSMLANEPTVSSGGRIDVPFAAISTLLYEPKAGGLVRYIGQATSPLPTQSVSAPVHEVGDLLLVISSVGDYDNRLFPTLAGFTVLFAELGFSCQVKVQYRIATSTSFSIPAWADTAYGADSVTILVYRNAAIGAYEYRRDEISGNGRIYPAVSLQNTDGSSRILRIADMKSYGCTLTPDGYIERVSSQYFVNVVESASGVTSAPAVSLPCDPYRTVTSTIELKYATPTPTPSISPSSCFATLAPIAPVVSSGACVGVPEAGTSVAPLNPAHAGPQVTIVTVPSLTTTLSAVAVQVNSGASVLVPITSVGIEAVAPALSGGTISYFASLSAQVYDGLRDFRVDWWGD